jgi:hypothetical protein
MVVVLLQHERAHSLVGDGGSFGGDGVALSAAIESVQFQMIELETYWRMKKSLFFSRS